MDYWIDDPYTDNPWDSPWDDPWGPGGPHSPFQQKDDELPDEPGGGDQPQYVSYTADTWGFFDTDGDQVHDENEIFLFADQTVTVEDTDGTAGDFFDTFTVWQGS